MTESRITAPFPKSRDLETVKNSLLERYSEAFQEEPFKAMQGPPMHIEFGGFSGTLPAYKTEEHTISVERGCAQSVREYAGKEHN